MGEAERGECCQPSEYEIRDDDQYEESRPGGSYRACVMIVKESVACVQKNQQVEQRKTKRTFPCQRDAGYTGHDNDFVEPENFSYPVTQTLV